jgi:hypothetical protein
MIPVGARVHPVKDYHVFAIDLALGPYADLELDVAGKGRGRPATTIWILKTTFPLSIKINSRDNLPIPIEADETPLILDGVEVERLYVTVTATTGVLYIVAFYPK